MIVFRTNGGPKIGYGHVYRMISLAKAIHEKDFNIKIVFIINQACRDVLNKYPYEIMVSEKFNDSNLIASYKPQAIIFDSYLANNQYLFELKKIAPLLILDDNNDIYNSEIPTVIINGNIHAKNLKYKTKVLEGPKYLIMRPEYWEVSLKESHNMQLTITTGGADFNHLMPKFVNALNSIGYSKKVIIGPGYLKDEIHEIEKIQSSEDQLIYKPDSLVDIFKESSVVLTASGTSVYEVLRMNALPVVYILADNQKMIAQELEKYGVKIIGNYATIDFKKLRNIVTKEILDAKRRLEQLSDLFDLFDGKGSLRVAEYIIEKVIK